MVRILGFHCCEAGSIPGRKTEICKPRGAARGKKEKILPGGGDSQCKGWRQEGASGHRVYADCGLCPQESPAVDHRLQATGQAVGLCFPGLDEAAKAVLVPNALPTGRRCLRPVALLEVKRSKTSTSSSFSRKGISHKMIPLVIILEVEDT